MQDPTNLRRCSKCGVEQPLENYHRSKFHKGGHVTVCKQCRRIYERAYCQKNKERVNENHRRWWGENPEAAIQIRSRRAAGKRAWYWRTRERRCAVCREWYRTHAAWVRTRHQIWLLQNKDKSRAAVRRRKARKRAAGALLGHHTEAEWHALLETFNGRCAWCGTSARITRDHIMPLHLGGSDTIENIQPLCASCNSRKGLRILVFAPIAQS